MARKTRKRGVVESVVVPAASAVVLSAAALHSYLDRRRRGDAGEGDAAEADVNPAEATRGGFLDKLGDRLPWLAPAVAVQRRYGEVGGNHLAAAFTLVTFLSLFPLLLAGVAVLGFVAAGSDTDLAGRIASQLGLTGEAARTLTEAVEAAESSRRAATVAGLVGLGWSGLGLVGALQYTYDSVWQVKGRGLKDKLFALAWLGGATLLFIAGAGLTAALHWLPGVLASVAVLVGLGVSFALWLWTSRVLPNRKVAWRHLVPGAIVGAVGLEVLKWVGAFWVPKAVASSSALYGSLGVVFAVLAWLAIFGRLVVYSAVTNVVAYERRVGWTRGVVALPALADVEGSDVAAGAAPLIADRSGRLVSTR